MKKLTLKRKEIPNIIVGLGKVTGMKDFKKSISLGRDRRMLKGIQDETEDAMKICKPESYDGLLEEYNGLKQKKAKEFELKDGETVNENAIGSHVMLTWSKSKDWTKVIKDYDEAVAALGNEEVELEVHTELLEKDIPKSAEDVSVAEILGYFVKD